MLPRSNTSDHRGAYLRVENSLFPAAFVDDFFCPVALGAADGEGAEAVEALDTAGAGFTSGIGVRTAAVFSGAGLSWTDVEGTSMIGGVTVPDAWLRPPATMSHTASPVITLPAMALATILCRMDVG